MAPVKKRKSGNGLSDVSEPTNGHSSRPAKRTRHDGKPTSEPSSQKAKNGGSAVREVLPKTSLLKAEEPIFPRGGASVLTPLEHKQIQLEAARDVLFEDKNSIVIQKDKEQGAEDRKKKRKRPNVPPKSEPDTQTSSVFVQGLSYRRLEPGTLVLGIVSEITEHDIGLALPNNLTGYVPISSVSSILSQKLEKLVALDDSDGEDESQDGNEAAESRLSANRGDAENVENTQREIDLNNFFAIGQFLRARVSSKGNNTAENDTETRRHIELSIRPEQVNDGLQVDKLAPNTTVQASVASVEDHGIIVDVELGSSAVKGFISNKDTGENVDLSTLMEGTVLLCLFLGMDGSGKTLKLSSDLRRLGDVKRTTLNAAPTIDSCLPGTVVEVAISEVSSTGFVGTAMGLIDVVSDVFHSGVLNSSGHKLRLSIGSKHKARITFTNSTSTGKVFGVSLLSHLTSLGQATNQTSTALKPPVQRSAIIKMAKVVLVEPQLGLFLDLGIGGAKAFVAKHRVKDSQVDVLSESEGPFKVGSIHSARITAYSPTDRIFFASMQQSVIDQPFLFVQDIPVGLILSGTVEKKAINSSGFVGLEINLAKGISGFVQEIHLSDVKLRNPESKYKIGASVKARVLSTDPSTNKVRLTLKKSLINTDKAILKSYADAAVGAESLGMIAKLLPNGAVLKFYSNVTAFLPLSEMSEAFLSNPFEHFREGQVLSVRVIAVDQDSERMLVSCRDAQALGVEQQKHLLDLKAGDIVTGKLIDKSTKDLIVQIEHSLLKTIVPFGHLSDSGDQGNRKELKKLIVGNSMRLLVLEKDVKKRIIISTKKTSLIKAAENHELLTIFKNAEVGNVVQGFVSNIIASGVFVQFGSKITALLPRSQISDMNLEIPNFGLKKFDSISCRILSIDSVRNTITLTQKAGVSESKKAAIESAVAIIDPVDDTLRGVEDLKMGRLTKVKISSVKETQLNVKLAKNVFGRIDVSEIFDEWDSISDPKKPLSSFKQNEVLSVKIIGTHDSRNHRFLPISHRTGGNTVFELTAKPSKLSGDGSGLTSLDQMQIGSQHIAFVNKIAKDHAWANVTVNTRGRINLMELSNNVSSLKNIEGNFPIGAALKVVVKSVNQEKKHLDLSAPFAKSHNSTTIDELEQDMVLPGRVVTVYERNITVRLTDSVIGMIGLTNLSDDYSTASTADYQQGEVLRVCVSEIDRSSKRCALSVRPSQVLSSTLPVTDRNIRSISDLKVQDVLRGFVSRVLDHKGVFVMLGPSVTGFVPVANLSDKFLQDWKAEYEIDQLVKVRVAEVDERADRILLTLKQSHLENGYKKRLTFNDLQAGQKLPGRVRKVESFGVFVVIDDSANISGLCHRSELSDEKVVDVQQTYNEGDKVLVKVLRFDKDKRRVSLGMKASYFKDEKAIERADTPKEDQPSQKRDVEMEEDQFSDNESVEGGVKLNGRDHITSPLPESEQKETIKSSKPLELRVPGFDWDADIFSDAGDQVLSDPDDLMEQRQKKKRKKAELPRDVTGDLDANGPQTSADFERLLLGQPDSSLLWVSYMAHELKLGEVSKARDLAERAIRTIGIREQGEKLNVWVALLNLENTYGSDDAVEKVFKEACQYCDAQDMHERLISIYIQSRKLQEADDLYQTAIKKFSFDPAIWTNYAHFLFNSASPPSPDRGRALHARALQALPSHSHIALTSKLAQLEFKSEAGEAERGRTLFEGLLSQWPKRWDIWNVLIDLEIRGDDIERIRRLFNRVLSVKGLKMVKARYFFNRWQKFETAKGKDGDPEMVYRRASDFVAKAKEGKVDDDAE